MKTRHGIGLLLAAVLLTTAMLPGSGAKYVTSNEAGTLTIVWSEPSKQLGKHHQPGVGESVGSFEVTSENEGYYAFVLRGADGGSGGGGNSSGGPGRCGYGGTAKGCAYLTVDTYYMVAGAVGSNGTGGYESYFQGGQGRVNGGGGGGLSGIFKGSIAVDNEIAIAGGGGGGGGGQHANENHGGAGGNATSPGQTNGKGGQVWNGAAVGSDQNGAGGGENHGVSGIANGGGKHGDNSNYGGAGSRLQGGSHTSNGWGGGGGSGYNGGGSGSQSGNSNYCDGGGGGGSSWITSSGFVAFSSLPAKLQAYINDHAALETTTSGVYTDTVNYDGVSNARRYAGYVVVVYLGPNNPASANFLYNWN